MATKGKKGKAKPSKLQQEYRKARSLALHRVRRLEKKGYDFPDDIIPVKPEKITRKSITELKKLTPKELRQKALYFETPKGETLTIKEALNYEKEKQVLSSLRNLASARAAKEIKRRKETFHYDEAQVLSLSPLQKGQELYKQYNYIIQHYGRDTALDFLKSLSEEDYELFEFGSKVAEGDYSRRETYEESEPEYVSGTGREDREVILPDEGAEYEEDYEDDSTFEPERSGEIESGRSEAEKDNEENLDEATRRWKENYNKEKRKNWKNRSFVSDGEAIYAGMKERIRMFEDECRNSPNFYARHMPNELYAGRFEAMLEDTISIDGFDTVMRRLDGKGYEIDRALDAMLHDSSEEVRSAAYAQLAEIIKGRASTLQESMRYEQAALYSSYDPEDEEVEGIDILE